MSRVRILPAVLTFIAASAWVPLYGQAVGTIVGVVTDPGQAVVPSAKITATQQGTNFSRETTTSGSGDFTLPRLPVGTYKLTVEASGFDTQSTDVKLDVAQTREVNFTMKLIGVATTVDVTATAETINTTN